jgi:hypothetical protein
VEYRVERSTSFRVRGNPVPERCAKSILGLRAIRLERLSRYEVCAERFEPVGREHAKNRGLSVANSTGYGNAKGHRSGPLLLRRLFQRFHGCRFGRRLSRRFSGWRIRLRRCRRWLGRRRFLFCCFLLLFGLDETFQRAEALADRGAPRSRVALL